TIFQKLQKSKDTKSLLGSVKELENIKYLPEGMSEKFSSLIASAKQLEGTSTGGNTDGNAEMTVACEWFCQAVVLALAKLAYEKVKKEWDRWPCPGNTWPTEGDGNP